MIRIGLNGEEMSIQNLRDFQRPYLTMLFATSYIACIIILILAVIKWFFANPEDTDLLELVSVVLGIIGLIGTPLGAIMGYHFAKSTKKDSAP